MKQLECGIRWWMSATRPATEFSIGIIARSTPPVARALKTSSNVSQGTGDHVRIFFPRSGVGIGAGLALKGDAAGSLVFCHSLHPIRIVFTRFCQTNCGRVPGLLLYPHPTAPCQQSKHRCACPLQSPATVPASLAFSSIEGASATNFSRAARR